MLFKHHLAVWLLFQVGNMNETKDPESVPTTEKKLTAREREEARRARLLEKAASEARQRKQDALPDIEAATPISVIPPSRPTEETAEQPNNPPPSEEVAQILKGLVGMSIDDVMKMKNGPRKRRKIVVSS